MTTALSIDRTVIEFLLPGPASRIRPIVEDVIRRHVSTDKHKQRSLARQKDVITDSVLNPGVIRPLLAEAAMRLGFPDVSGYVSHSQDIDDKFRFLASFVTDEIRSKFQQQKDSTDDVIAKAEEAAVDVFKAAYTGYMEAAPTTKTSLNKHKSQARSLASDRAKAVQTDVVNKLVDNNIFEQLASDAAYQCVKYIDEQYRKRIELILTYFFTEFSTAVFERGEREIDLKPLFVKAIASEKGEQAVTPGGGLSHTSEVERSEFLAFAFDDPVLSWLSETNLAVKPTVKEIKEAYFAAMVDVYDG